MISLLTLISLNPAYAASTQEISSQEMATQQVTVPARQPEVKENTTQELTLDLNQKDIGTQEIVAPFKDVPVGHKYMMAIGYLKEQGLVQGYDDGTFKPDREINRAEALKILQKAITGESAADTQEKTFDTQEKVEKFSFADVKDSDWFYAYVADAWDRKLVKGYPDGLFHPEQTINLAESLKICLLKEGKPIPEKVDEQPYGDVPIDAWFAPFAQAAKARTLVLASRPEGNLNGDMTMTRGSFASLIYKMLLNEQGFSFIRATWYGNEFANWGTASGEVFDPAKMTAAHRKLPFGTKLQVTNPANGQSIEVVINDRGPYSTGIELDLSRAAFEAIASLGAGVIPVQFRETPKVNEYGF